MCLKEILYICTVKWKYELKTFKTNFRMRRILLFTVLVYLTTALFAGDKKQLPQHTFAVDKLCGYTSVLNQAKTSTCWAHATASLLESDRLFAGGDTVRLSVMYIARQKYLEQLMQLQMLWIRQIILLYLIQIYLNICFYLLMAF